MIKGIRTALAFLLILIGLTACKRGEEETEELKADPVTITNAISLRASVPDMSGYEFLNDHNPAFLEISYAESLRMFTEGGSGILFYGSDACFYCNRAVVVLNETAKEAGIIVYYIDVMDAAGSTRSDYDELMTYLEPTFREDEQTGEMAFYVPDVIGVKDGNITAWHVSLVDGFSAADDAQLSDKQHDELKQIYIDIFNATDDAAVSQEEEE